MADEFDLELDEGQEDVSKAEKRIKNLSEKVKTTAQERDEFAKAKADEETKRLAAEKERDFFKNFTPLTSKYQGAAEFQTEIWDKVKTGYTEEDATVAVLVNKGKYTPPPQAPEPLAPRENPAGGSAATAMPGTGDKTLTEMSRDEKRAQLEEISSRGDLRFGKG